MKPHPSPSLVFTAQRLLALAGLFSLLAAHGAEKPDYKAIAEKIVGQSANVKEGDRVVLRGEVRDLDLLEELGFATLRRGAEPMQIVMREKSARRYFDEVPAERDAMPLQFSKKLAEAQTVEIAISGQEFPELMSDVPPARLTANSKRGLDVYQTRLKAGVRVVELGNGLYPTDATAKRYGISKDQLSVLFWSGVNVDYSKLQATGVAVSAALKGGKQVRITNSNGTDFTCRIDGREVNVSDGVISAEDIKQGPPATQVWLPAGEVYVVPVAGSAEGKIVFDLIPFEGGEIVGATFTFKAGKLTGHTAKAGASYDRWKALYAAAPAGKDEFAYVDLGINPNVKVPAGSKLSTWVPAGTVSLGIGNNAWAGGTNVNAFGAGGSINGCTVTVDGKTVVENGTLKMQ